ncbi:MAG: TonB-dependent receptor [Rhodospirillales bacterium]|nr:TonB-dependent receptor [Rhodospirillales bacterium]
MELSGTQRSLRRCTRRDRPDGARYRLRSLWGSRLPNRWAVSNFHHGDQLQWRGHQQQFHQLQPISNVPDGRRWPTCCGRHWPDWPRARGDRYDLHREYWRWSCRWDAIHTNIYDPIVVAKPNIPTLQANKVSTTTLSSLGLADTLSAAGKRIQLTAGARLQQVTAANFNPTTGAQTSYYNQSALSPSVALVFKPWQNVSIYGNWIQGLERGTIVGATFANAGEIFPPYKSTQYEAGIKVDWGKFTTTASVFQISRPFTFADVTTNTLVLGGDQRNQGVELNVFGEPMEGVRLLGGVMFLDAVLAKTQSGLTDGWIAPFSPGFSLNLAGEWDLPFVRGLTLNGRIVYTGSQYIDTTWPRRSLPEWTRFDLGARYAFENPGAKGRLLVARFNVENVLDSNYWVSGTAATTLFLGMPRKFLLSLTADF